jgi:sulfatase maturation enzyme AslB (radical SAM superfamily)
MDSKCAAFWKHTNIRSDNRIFPCCRFKEPVDKFNGNVEEILFYESYQTLRTKSQNGEYISGCNKCYHEESIGKVSLRQQFNKEYDTDFVSLKYLEIGFDNICNLTCDGCWSEFSNEWAKKEGLDKTIQIKSTETITTVPDTIEKIVFLGGEPLMTNRHVKFLQLVKHKESVDVNYNTNGTFLFSDVAIELLKGFRNVNIILSIDGYKDLNEQVRSGSKWDQILTFIEQIKQLQYNLKVHTVVHMNSWRGLNQLEEFVNTITDNWNVNFLTYPSHLDIINETDQDQLLDMLHSVKSIDLSHIINRLVK